MSVRDLVCLLVTSSLFTGAPVSEAGQDLVQVAPGAATVEYEDARLRVVRLRLPPRGSLPMHDRPARVVIPLTRNDVRITPADGGTRVTRADAHRPAWSEPTRRAVSNLDTPLENIVVELKTAAAAARPIPKAPLSPPPDYLQDPRHQWVFENQYVRVYDVRIPPGETTSLHRHALDSVVIYVSGGRVATQDEGQAWGETTTIARGSVTYAADASKPKSHRVRNDGTGEYHVIIVQLLR